MAYQLLLQRYRLHHKWMNAATLVLLGSIVAAGLVGLFGGYDHRSAAEGGNASLKISGPSIIRNGEYDEMTIEMMARRPIGNAALEIDAAFWREITINTMIPAPEKEELRNGIMRFEFGALDAGETAQFKIDAQVNPHRFGASEGRFVLLDGNRPLVSLARELTVMP
jgi:hypothetical protein